MLEVVSVETCGAQANAPVPQKFPAIPLLSKKSESKMTNPFEAVGLRIGSCPVPTVPAYAPLEPVAFEGVVFGPLYTHTALVFKVPTAVPEVDHPAGIPFAKVSLQITVSGPLFTLD
jgi:hypothetical protein